MIHTRRNFLKGVTLGTAGLALDPFALTGRAAMRTGVARSSVSFMAGSDRRENIYNVLKPFRNEIAAAIEGKQVVIKPNCVWDGNPLCATHPDAIRGLLDFLKPIYDKTVIIGESTASPKGTFYTFNEYGYLPIADEFDVKYVDLNADSYQVEWITNRQGHPLDIKIIRTFLDPNNYIISLARMKTHDCVVSTLTLKNMVMASPLNVMKGHSLFVRNQSEKAKMHEGGSSGINYNMYLIAHRVRPQLAIIDGFVGMEGNGPGGGTPVEHGVALAGFDTVSVDRIGTELMGITYTDIAYLQWCSAAGLGIGDRANIEILGPDLDKHVIPYKLHDNIERQLRWKDGR